MNRQNRLVEKFDTSNINVAVVGLRLMASLVVHGVGIFWDLTSGGVLTLSSLSQMLSKNREVIEILKEFVKFSKINAQTTFF